MKATCGYANPSRVQNSQSKNYTVFCPGANPGTIENYLLVSLDGMGFVVLKETIDIEEEG